MVPLMAEDRYELIDHVVSDRHRKLQRKTTWFWALPLLYTIIGTALLVSLVMAMLSTSIAAAAQDDYYYGSACDPMMHDNGWSVVIAAGHFTFLEAKPIDVAWNVGVGRAGQLLLVWPSYVVLYRSLVRLAEADPIPQNLYTSVSIFGPTISTLMAVLQHTYTTKGARGKALLIFMAYAVSVVVAWPTMLDLATGYIPNQKPVIALPNGYLVPYDYSWDFFQRNPEVCGYKAEDIDIWDNMKCMPDNTFAWGFSLWWPITISCVYGIWLWGLFGLWVDSYRCSICHLQEERPGVYRVMVDISEAIRPVVGSEITSISNKAIKKKLNEGKVTFRWRPMEGDASRLSLQVTGKPGKVESTEIGSI